MARLAGSSSHYEVGLLDAEGNATPHKWRFPSVTHVLDAVIAKPRLMAWMYKKGIEGVDELYRKYGAKMPHDAQSLHDLLKQEKLTPWAARDKGGDTGKKAHAQVEDWCAGGDPKWTPESVGFKNWVADRGLDREAFVASEVPLVSFKHQFAGTVDLIYRAEPVTERLILSDVKTSRFVAWTHLVQTQAYEIAWIEQGGDPIWKNTILQIRPESEYPRGWREFTTDALAPDTFLKILDIYHSLPDDWAPEEISFPPTESKEEESG